MKGKVIPISVIIGFHTLDGIIAEQMGKGDQGTGGAFSFRPESKIGVDRFPPGGDQQPFKAFRSSRSRFCS